MINFICSPGIGHLDNALPLINGLNKKFKCKSNIVFTKINMINHLINNPLLLKLHNKSFKSKFIILDNFVILFSEIEKINELINNKILFFYILKFSIFFKINFILSLICKKYNIQITNIDKIFNQEDIIIFDPLEVITKKSYFKKIYNRIYKNFKIGLRHGNGNDYLNKQNKSKEFKIENLIYLSHSKKQTTYIKKKINLTDENIIFSGVLKYSDDWKRLILKKEFNKKKSNFVYIISRHNSDYFSKEKKIRLIKILRNVLIQKYNLKLIIKLHPKETPSLSLPIYYKVLGSQNLNKTWYISNNHSFKICSKSAFGISFLSSVSLDMLEFKKPTIEILNIDNKENENNYYISFAINKLVLNPKSIKDFEIIIKNILSNNTPTYLFNNYSKIYYKPNNKRTFKKIIKFYYEYCNNLC